MVENKILFFHEKINVKYDNSRLNVMKFVSSGQIDELI